MKILKIILILGIISSLNSCSQQHSIPSVGEKIFDYEFSDVINGQSTSINEMKGKPIILEFWATWCGPCIPAIKKLDSLQLKYMDDLEIITISFDKRERLDKFISRNNIHVRVSFDTIHQEAFNYEVIPHSILIDKNGVVQAITSPTSITEQTIIDLIADKQLVLEEKNDFLKDISSVRVIKEIRDSKKNLILTNHNPTERVSSKINWSPDGIANGLEYHNLTLPSIFKSLFKIRSYKRLKFLDSLSTNNFEFKPENQFNLIIELSEGMEDRIYEIGQDFMNNNFDINGRKVIDTSDVYILVNTSAKLKESKAENPQYFSRGPTYVADRQPISQLLGYLENIMDMPVVDKTNLTNLYDITLNWDTEKLSTLHAELEKYGLKLEKSDKPLPIEVLEIYKKEK